MNEEYVSYELARQLKEKGFAWPCAQLYSKELHILIGAQFTNEKSEDSFYAAPALHMAQRWLREEKDIHVMVDVCASGYYAVLQKTDGTFIRTLANAGPNEGDVWDTYEDALSAGINLAVYLLKKEE